jgi:signal transduction histidine kinase
MTAQALPKPTTRKGATSSREGGQADRRGIHLDVQLQPAETAGDARLAERLISNLVDNGIRHNNTGGRLEVRTVTKADRSVVSVANSGPIVPAAEVERLFQPFERLRSERTDHSDGIGLGLSIVTAVAAAHTATLTAHPQPEGGLRIEVGFPQPVATVSTVTRARTGATIGRAWFKRLPALAHESHAERDTHRAGDRVDYTASS